MRPRRVPLAALAILLLSGCAAPAAPPADDGPVDVSGRLGLMLVDLDARSVLLVSQQALLGWLSPNASVLTWTEINYAVVLDRTTGARDVGPVVDWARVYDNGTGLHLDGQRARLRGLVDGSDVAATPVPSTPPGVEDWLTASDDLRVLGAELVGERPLECANDLYLRSDSFERARGCHLRVAADGRAGWTEGTAIRVRARDGALADLPQQGSGGPSGVRHENPVFTANGTLFLRVHGGTDVSLTELVDAAGTPLAKLDGPYRLALLDASLDGRRVLVRVFAR